ncbi:MAG TPA: energy-coupling factor transporter transmembrane protein EcfT [Thermomicrobiales bacterium]|nr:energy-coupling factor transporter transmembrane protein EcfT [Thermomicrobiales bacterium]
MTARQRPIRDDDSARWLDPEPEDPRLDPRAWLAWALAASLPPLASRNPLVLLMVLAAVLGVRAAWSPVVSRAGAWGGIVRLAVLFAAIGALFNLLTVRIGESVLYRLPEAWPLIGGPLTLNALVYGLLTGLALLTLVLIGTTLGMVLDWPMLLRQVPSRLTPVAVAGSVAWAFLPQTAIALREIREARSARGYHGRGPGGFVSLLVPLLSGGLERALMLAEAMEARGFGATLGEPSRNQRWCGISVAMGLSSGIIGGYLFAAGDPLIAGAFLAMGLCLLAIAERSSRSLPRQTRLRTIDRGRRETVIVAGAALALLGIIVTLIVDPSALGYDPYPRLVVPRVPLGLLASLAALLAPAFVVPVGSRREAGNP